MKRLLGAILLFRGAAVAAPADACSLIPQARIAPILGTTKNIVIGTAKLPSTVTESRACTYAGQENVATVILIKFDGEDGFSFAGGMLAVRKNVVLRVNVRPRIPTGRGTVNPTLSRELLLELFPK